MGMAWGCSTTHGDNSSRKLLRVQGRHVISEAECARGDGFDQLNTYHPPDDGMLCTLTLTISTPNLKGNRMPRRAFMFSRLFARPSPLVGALLTCI